MALAPPRDEDDRWRVNPLRKLVGSGDRMALFIAPFGVLALILVIVDPPLARVVGPPDWLRILAVPVLVVGLVIWLWSVVLILRDVPRGRLITTGPYAWVKHPLYTAVALLVLPSIGFLLDTWLGLVLGVALYLGSRIFAPEEEAALSRAFGDAWRDYTATVKLGWL
jgi:protein-S-isoprenylcysteine O-methyltransferase Ste14